MGLSADASWLPWWMSGLRGTWAGSSNNRNGELMSDDNGACLFVAGSWMRSAVLSLANSPFGTSGATCHACVVHPLTVAAGDAPLRGCFCLRACHIWYITTSESCNFALACRCLQPLQNSVPSFTAAPVLHLFSPFPDHIHFSITVF
jgi:hypothetical protein